jgi:hypothetical protein
MTKIIIDGSTPATYSEISTRQVCPFCHQTVKMGVHMWVKANGQISHDYCARIAALEVC